jgi:hypothetical protein
MRRHMTNIDQTTNAVEIISDGRTVWINESAGMCIGRFSARGIDIHQGAAAQLRGEPQCLDCAHGLPFDEAWERFKTSIHHHHGVVIDDAYKPHIQPRKNRLMTQTDGRQPVDNYMRGYWFAIGYHDFLADVGTGGAPKGKIPYEYHDAWDKGYDAAVIEQRRAWLRGTDQRKTMEIK